ncbi:restriction endonuclease subunit S [Methanobrevibacter boviskoreani]|uniref:restriction endonuclease subunit S n=1 Tax=Methanobrevibacter boviskoreani TaxID=1348249 RepID=UPI0006ACC683|nr:restriction endonuclease subunit S [Methanobrevibacter boviskoreani]
MTISAQYGLIDQKEYFNKIVASKSLANYYLLKKGDFAYNKSYSTGYPYGTIKRLNKYDKGAVSTLYICFKPRNIDSNFLEQYFETDKWYKKIYKIAVEGARNHGLLNIAISDFFNTKHYIPKSKDEQIKISKFLEIVDEKIDLLEKKKEIKLKIKEYYIQQIFLEDWDNKIKFYDYKPLNEITFYQEGPGVRNYQYTNKGVKLLNVGNFVKNKLILENTDRYISKEEAYGKYKHFLVDEGDLLIACSGIKAEYFNEKIAFAEKKDLPLCMNTSTMRFKSLDDNYLNLNYLKWYFQTPLFKKEIFRILTGSAQFNFGPTHLKYLKILIPPLDYQIKIGNFMDLIKENIDYIDIKIKLMKQFKKGLLQKMFV